MAKYVKSNPNRLWLNRPGRPDNKESPEHNDLMSYNVFPVSVLTCRNIQYSMGMAKRPRHDIPRTKRHTLMLLGLLMTYTTDNRGNKTMPGSRVNEDSIMKKPADISLPESKKIHDNNKKTV